jgi:hypothetical protein
VHRRCRVDEHPASRIEAVAAEQPAHPSERALRQLTPLADDGAIDGPYSCERWGSHRFIW